LVLVVLAACLAPPEVQESEGEADAYLTGFAQALLESELGWATSAFSLRVEDRIAQLYLTPDLLLQANQAREKLLAIDGIEAVAVHDREVPDTATAAPEQSGFLAALGLEDRWVQLPAGDMFQPLLADPKQPQFFVSYREYDTTDAGSVTVGEAAYGETFGLLRLAGKRAGDGAQLGLSGGLFSQFNLDTPSDDLINADYTVGLPLTYRRGPYSLRLRIYHQSSHLGDTVLLGEIAPDREDLSFESIELLGSLDVGRWRGYLGGEYLFRHNPDEVDPSGLHGGLEYRGHKPLLGNGRPVGGVDIKSWEQHEWQADIALKLGLEFGDSSAGKRRLRLMLEAYDGFAPHGQFYEQEVTYFGCGLYVGF
jgi:hypothetical protein